MIDGGTVPPVESNEWLARFILNRIHLRQDRTVRQDAFIPHPWPDLSVTRHLQLTQTELWKIGQDVAREVGKTLHGRANVQAFAFQRQCCGLANRKVSSEAKPSPMPAPGSARYYSWKLFYSCSL